MSTISELFKFHDVRFLTRDSGVVVLNLEKEKKERKKDTDGDLNLSKIAKREDKLSGIHN